MSILQRQVIQSLDGLSEDNLSFLLEIIQRFMKPSENEEEHVDELAMNKKIVRRIGSLEGQDLIDVDYVIAFSKHKNRTMYFDFGHKH